MKEKYLKIYLTFFALMSWALTNTCFSQTGSKEDSTSYLIGKWYIISDGHTEFRSNEYKKGDYFLVINQNNTFLTNIDSNRDTIGGKWEFEKNQYLNLYFTKYNRKKPDIFKVYKISNTKIVTTYEKPWGKTHRVFEK